MVPNHYPVILWVRAPDPRPEGWWSAYRDLFETIASIGERHTSSPGRAWFAVWDGHGFANATSHYARQGTVDDATREAIEQERSRLRDEDERRNAAIRVALAQLPRFDLPHRSYFLLAGSVSAASQMQDPGPLVEWRHPDLFWPEDRRWFVATDVDFWSLYIGGDPDFVAEVAGSVPTDSEIVGLDRPLETEV